jgi:hypothetical protein
MAIVHRRDHAALMPCGRRFPHRHEEITADAVERAVGMPAEMAVSNCIAREVGSIGVRSGLAVVVEGRGSWWRPKGVKGPPAGR